MDHVNQDSSRTQRRSSPSSKDSTPKAGNASMSEALSTNLPNMSEAFVRIETKDGQSTERIPFMEFFQRILSDKGAGGLEMDFAQLLQGDGRDSDISEVADTVTVAVTSKSPPKAHESGVLPPTSAPNVKKRGRPSLSKNVTGGKKSRLDRSSYEGNDTTIMQFAAVAKSTPSRTSKVSTVGPRRSLRTPTRNTRFGDDFVDSTKLRKPPSTPWNAQLMTLALAAERHETSPEKNDSLVQELEKSSESVTVSVSNDAVLKMNRKVGKICYEALQKRTIALESSSVEDSAIKGITPERKKVDTTVASLKGPKILKKYSPVNPVVKRSLPEALRHSVLTSKDHLYPEVGRSQAAYFYTIMEPKAATTGHGLLVHKVPHGLKFSNAVIDGDLPPAVSANQNVFPQDRFFSCELCNTILLSSSSWLQHNQNVHQRQVSDLEGSKPSKEGKGNFSCRDCGQSFPYKFMLDIHVKRRRHNESKSFRCMLCRQSFCNQREREEHWLMSHPARNCGLCGKQFTNIVMLRRHINNNCHGARTQHKKHRTVGGVSADKGTDLVVITEGKGQDHSNSGPKTLNGGQAKISETGQTIKLSSLTADIDFVPDVTDNNNDIENTDSIIVSSRSVARNESVSVLCNVCHIEFSSHLSLWNHKLETKHFKPGFQGQLKEKLTKLEEVDKDSSQVDESSLEGKSKFYVIMRPRLSVQIRPLNVETNEKEFSFHSSKLENTDVSDDHSTQVEYDSEDVSMENVLTFHCSQCAKTFTTASEYREHRSQEHNQCFETVRLLGAFQCSHCSDTFPCQFMLDRHEKRHAGKRALPCTLCGLTFHKIQDRREHWKKEHPGIGCPNCGKMYASIKFLQKHISLNCQDHFPPTQKFLEFRKKQHSDFEMKLKDKRVEKKILRCHLCPKICSSVHGWRRHMGKAHEDAGFSKLSNTCIICNKLVYGYKALEKHLLEVHAEDTGLPVDEETKMVEEAVKKSDVDLLSYHKAGRDAEEIFQDEFGSYHCPSCTKTHTDLSALKTHIKTHVDMGLECKVCHKMFKNPVLLKQHVQRHRKEAIYSCETCHKKFMTLQKLNKHRKVHHRDQAFTCELCGMTFAQNEYLQKHLRCHMDRRPHSCNICEKTFRSKPELRVHVLIHTRETPYKCEHCGRGFSQKGNYRVHLAQHTGHKPYQCDQCQLTFALQCHLRRHKLIHDQKVQYRCVWCGKECTQRKHMQMHVQRVHKEDFFHYEELMKLDTPVPIAASQIKMYNRKLGKPSKVRRPYQTKAEKCNSTIDEILGGVITKIEPGVTADELGMTQIMEAVTSELPILTSVGEPGSSAVQPEHYESLVAAGTVVEPGKAGRQVSHLLNPDDVVSQKLEIVLGDNNHISIIVQDPGSMPDVVGVEGLPPIDGDLSADLVVASTSGPEGVVGEEVLHPSEVAVEDGVVLMDQIGVGEETMVDLDGHQQL